MNTRPVRWPNFLCGQMDRHVTELIVAFRQHADKLQSFSPELALWMLKLPYTVHVESQSSTYHFKCESKFSTTYGPTRPVADSALTPPPTAASRILGMSAGACYIGNLPSLPRDHMSSPAYSNGGSSSKIYNYFRLTLFICTLFRTSVLVFMYRGADKSLARPERKQATTTEDFDFHISYL